MVLNICCITSCPFLVLTKDRIGPTNTFMDLPVASSKHAPHTLVHTEAIAMGVTYGTNVVPLKTVA